MARNCHCDHIHRMRENGQALDVCHGRDRAGNLLYVEIGMGDVALFRTDDEPTEVILEIARGMVRRYNEALIAKSEVAP